MKAYLLIYFCAIAITSPVKSSSLEYETGQNVPNNLAYIARAGTARNLNLLNPDLLPNELNRNNLLRQSYSNYLNLYNPVENNNLGRQGDVNLENDDPVSAELSAAVNKYLENSKLDTGAATLIPEIPNRFGHGGFGGGGGLGGGVGGGIGGGISGGIGLAAGIGGSIGAHGYGHGYGHGGLNHHGYGYPNYGK